jgi:hypothetical protein
MIWVINPKFTTWLWNLVNPSRKKQYHQILQHTETVVERPWYVQWLWMKIYKGLQPLQENRDLLDLQISCWTQCSVWWGKKDHNRHKTLPLIDKVFLKL